MIITVLFLAIALLMHSQIVGIVVVPFLALFCVQHVLKNVQKSVRSEISKETKPK